MLKWSYLNNFKIININAKSKNLNEKINNKKNLIKDDVYDIIYFSNFIKRNILYQENKDFKENKTYNIDKFLINDLELLIEFILNHQKEKGFSIIPIAFSYRKKLLNLLKKLSQYYSKLKFIRNSFSELGTYYFLILINFSNKKKKSTSTKKNRK